MSRERGEIRLWLRAFLPTWIAVAYAIVVLPTEPGTPFLELEPHQQVGSVGVPLSLVWSILRAVKFGAGDGGVSEA